MKVDRFLESKKSGPNSDKLLGNNTVMQDKVPAAPRLIYYK